LARALRLAASGRAAPRAPRLKVARTVEIAMSCMVKKIWFWLFLKDGEFGKVLKITCDVLCFQRRSERSLYLRSANSFLFIFRG